MTTDSDTRRPLLTRLAAVLAASLLALGAVACDSDDDGIEDTGVDSGVEQELDEAGTDVEQGLEEAGDEIEQELDPTE